ncbi:MAG: histidine phosphatase family protein [Candidatus Norongarragalinales archaeon]
MNTRIFLVRHGITDGNKKKITQGRLDFELNSEGRRQAKTIANRLSKTKFHAIYSSTLKRASQTTSEIAKHHNCRVIHSKLLEERSFGKFEGMHYDAVDIYRYSPLKRPPGGESIKDVYERAKPLLKKILVKNEGKTILIVSHGIIGRAILCILLRIPVSKANLFGTQKNTSITEVEITPNGPKLVRFNDHAHLED